eukprot:12165294-Prorocentrum_lima.AAC.1
MGDVAWSAKLFDKEVGEALESVPAAPGDEMAFVTVGSDGSLPPKFPPGSAREGFYATPAG